MNIGSRPPPPPPRSAPESENPAAGGGYRLNRFAATAEERPRESDSGHASASHRAELIPLPAAIFLWRVFRPAACAGAEQVRARFPIIHDESRGCASAEFRRFFLLG